MQLYQLMVLLFCGINYELEQQNELREKNPLCERGYIEYSDLEYIVENDMSAIDISKYTDGWYSCFPYVELYQSFKKEDVKEQFLDIIHSAIYSKIHSLKSTGYWYYCADNMLSLGDWCEFDWDWNELFSIFCKFIICISICIRCPHSYMRNIPICYIAS